MKRVIEDIKTGEFKQIYLFTGSEDYLKFQYRDKLIQALMPEGDTMNLSRFQGKGQDVREIISLGETMPFFAERRMIVLEDTGFFKNSCGDLADYLERIPEYLYPVSYTHLYYFQMGKIVFQWFFTGQSRGIPCN